MLLLIFSTVIVWGQDCDCTVHFEWATKTFIENDAGFQHIVDKKGATAYENHHATFTTQVKKITDLEECRVAKPKKDFEGIWEVYGKYCFC